MRKNPDKLEQCFLFHINQQIKVQPNKILIGESVAFDNKHNGIQTAKDNRDIR